MTLRLRRGDEKQTVNISCGDGPIDAIFLAIEQVTGISVVCRDFNVHSVTVGKDAQGEVLVQVEHDGQLYRGRAVSTDSIEASPGRSSTPSTGSQHSTTEELHSHGWVDAAVCGLASSLRPSGGIGRRSGFKIPWA